MPELPVALVVVLVIGLAAAVVGLGFGRVIAPRIGRAVDRLDADADEEPSDRPS